MSQAGGLAALVHKRRDAILHIAARHGVSSVRLIGSAARGDDQQESDVDLLIDVSGPTTPWFPGGLVCDLEDLLGRTVDVVETCALREDVKRQILGEARDI